MSDTKNDFDGELNPEFWREYLEERERLAQLRDEADCAETVAKASEYAAAKVAYYNASSSIRSDRFRNECRQFGQQTAELSISSVC